MVIHRQAGYLTRDEVIARLAAEHDQRMLPGSWSAMVTRRQAPPPDSRVGRTPLWFKETIDAWASARPGRGRRSDLLI
jgi:hypothetical protein